MTISCNKTALIAAALATIAVPAVGKAAVLANWTFETSIPATAGPFTPETGSGSALGFHAGAAAYSSPAGNGSAHSFSSSLWAVGDYYQFSTTPDASTEYHITFDQTSSGTGPRDFQIQYSTDGTTFSNLSSYIVLQNGLAPNASWNSATSSPAYSYSADLFGVSPSATSLVFRLVDNSTTSAGGGTVGTGGTDRVDNFVINSGPVPEPASIGLVALAGALGFRRRR